MTNEFQKLVDQTNDDQFISYNAGDTVKGKVLDANSSRILVELPGGKTGIITKKETTGFGVESITDIEKDSEIEAFIINPENDYGLVVLSLRRASQEMVWSELNKCMDEGRIIKVKVTDANKGGLMSTYKGLKAFLPVSQLTPLNYPRVNGAQSAEILRKLNEHVGKEFAVCVLNASHESGKLIVSEKLAYKEQQEQTMKNLREGDVVQGEVSGVVDFGIFVTFGGAEGLVHLSEMDWKHVANPSKLYSLGDKVEILVLGIEKNKLSLSIKRLTEDPWKDEVSSYSEGQEVSGTVSRWNDNGVFIDIADNIKGLFGINQFNVENYSELTVKEGDEMKGVIEKIDFENHRFELKKVD